MTDPELVTCHKMHARITRHRCDEYRATVGSQPKLHHRPASTGIDCTGCPGPDIPWEEPEMANKPTLCTLCKVNPVWKNARSKEYRVEIAGTVFYGIGLCSACYTGLCTRTKTSDEGPIRRRLIKVGILPPEAEPTEVNDGKSRPEAPAASIPESKSDDQPAPEGNESRAGKLEGDEAPSRAETHPAEELPEKQIGRAHV